MAALLVGFIARLFGKYLEFVKPYIFSEDYKTVEAQDAGNEKIQYKNIIVIGREWSTAKHSTGSGKQINIVQTIIDIIQEESGGASSNFDLTINTDFGIDFIEKYIKEALNSQQDLSPV